MSISARASNEARYYTVEAGKVRCSLCPHSCLISDGKRGICGVRENNGGKLYSLIYGRASSIHLDPIEKKPFFHFLPGTTAMSFGSIGCNLSCIHCQNYAISKAKVDEFTLVEITPDEVVHSALEAGASSISWTYNEPTIWHEFTTEASKVAHGAGLKTNYVTNGYIQDEPLRELKGVIDAMNIDVKGFTEDFYGKVCGGKLAPVLRTCEQAVKLEIHVELTYLVIPGHNDRHEDLAGFSRWVVNSLGRDVPVHFSAFHPDYKLTRIPRTPQETLLAAYDIASGAGLEFVYLGNVHAGERDDTFCPKCRTLAVERDGFWARSVNLRDGKCSKCGASLNMIT